MLAWVGGVELGGVELSGGCSDVVETSRDGCGHILDDLHPLERVRRRRANVCRAIADLAEQR